MPVTGKYRMRVIILARSLGSKGANGERAESWPDPTPGTNEYFAARDTLTSGETIADGIRQSTGAMKIRIKGRAITVAASDRVKIKTTGEVFNVVGVAREFADTVLSLERAAGQSTPQ